MSKESNENLPRSTDMESSLRDRIAAVVKDSLFAQATWQGKVDNRLVADAVIEALAQYWQEVDEDEFLDNLLQ